MPSSLIIGSGDDCDVRLAVPSVSRRHCRITRDGASVSIEDLESRNGTYVNGDRIAGGAKVTLGPADVVHLGSHPVDLQGLLARLPSEAAAPQVQPSPAPAPTLVAAPAPAQPGLIDFTGESMVVGRVGGCDLVIELPMVSSRHARLTRSGADILVEDLGASNGTFVDGRRIAAPTVVPRGGLLGLGSATFRLSDRSWTSLPSIAPAPAASTGGVGSTAPVAVGAAILAAAPVLLGLAARATLRDAALVFAASLTVPVLGLLDALAASFLPPADGEGASTSRPWIVVGGIAALCLAQALAIQATTGLLGAGPVGAAVLFLAGLVGATAGLAAGAFFPAATALRTAAALALVALIGLTGAATLSAPNRPAPLTWASSASPARWAMEGLMLAADDPALERYFPAETERMGLPAAFAALGLMTLGLCAAAAAVGPTKGSAQPAFLAAGR